MTHIEQLHLDAITSEVYSKAKVQTLIKQAAMKSAEITEQVSCDFAIFFSGVMPMNCKDIMRRQDLPNEEKVKLIFQEYLKSKETTTNTY